MHHAQRLPAFDSRIEKKCSWLLAMSSFVFVSCSAPRATFGLFRVTWGHAPQTVGKFTRACPRCCSAGYYLFLLLQGQARDHRAGRQVGRGERGVHPVHPSERDHGCVQRELRRHHGPLQVSLVVATIATIDGPECLSRAAALVMPSVLIKISLYAEYRLRLFSGRESRKRWGLCFDVILLCTMILCCELATVWCSC